MKKKKLIRPNSIGYANALAEDSNNKIQAILEIIQPFPQMQENMKAMKSSQEILKDDVGVIKVIVKQMQPRLDATFEAVGDILVEITQIKQRLDRLERLAELHELDRKEIQELKRRVSKLEEKINA